VLALSPTPDATLAAPEAPQATADSAGAHLLARITRRSREQLGLCDGMPVFAQVKGVSLALK
jgi:ABC-type molybdate transport system ATPase subunit